MPNAQSIGPALAALRERGDLTQVELGERLGITAASVSRLESPSGNPRASSIVRYLDALGVGFDELAAMLRELDAPAAPPAQTYAAAVPYPELDEIAERGAEVFRDLAQALRRAKR